MGLHTGSLFRHFSLDTHFVLFLFCFLYSLRFHEGFGTKYNAEEGNIQKEIDFGNSLHQNGDVQNEACKQQIRSDVQKYNRRKSDLNNQ